MYRLGSVIDVSSWTSFPFTLVVMSLASSVSGASAHFFFA
ncbi:hypothetical protein [Vibrio cholerae]|nr:hypothetical protein [Vibrio cholerae]